MADTVLYIAADRPTAAERIAGKIEKNLTLLVNDPYLGHPPSDRRLMELAYRYLLGEDYLIFYTIEKQDILVHRILHGVGHFPMRPSA